jgi:hypothetical protein
MRIADKKKARLSGPPKEQFGRQIRDQAVLL